jgi:hypothetical protein
VPMRQIAFKFTLIHVTIGHDTHTTSA